VQREPVAQTAPPTATPSSGQDALEAAISTCLNSQFPMVVWWGPDLLMLYNATDIFDVIVSDIGMPDMDGYEFLAQLSHRGITTPVVALSAFAMRECTRAGARTFPCLHGRRRSGAEIEPIQFFFHHAISIVAYLAATSQFIQRPPRLLEYLAAQRVVVGIVGRLALSRL
jgi:CheY-like chemotaxis protein